MQDHAVIRKIIAFWPWKEIHIVGFKLDGKKREKWRPNCHASNKGKALQYERKIRQYQGVLQHYISLRMPTHKTTNKLHKLKPWYIVPSY